MAYIPVEVEIPEGQFDEWCARANDHGVSIEDFIVQAVEYAIANIPDDSPKV